MRYTPTAAAHTATQETPAPSNVVPMPTQPTQSTSKINFGGIAKKAAGQPKGKAYPVYPARPDEVQLADYLIANIPILDAVKTGKSNLIGAVTPFYFQQSAGKNDVESSVVVAGTKGQLLVTFPKMLSGAVAESDLSPILGSNMGRFFRSTFEIKVDGDKIPAASAQDLVNEMVALFARHNATDALSYRELMAANPEFHLRRHLDLTPDQNMAVNSKTPIRVSVKIKH